MSLIIKDPSASRLVLRRTWQPMDPDAAAYITAVEAADTAAGSPGGLEERTKIAIDNFVLGRKADGIWTAIKASCILAGARTLAGALQPLAGVAPTNVGPFVSGDYNRKTGLVGNGSTKYLDSNRASDAEAQNSIHLLVYAHTIPVTGAALIGVGNNGSNSCHLASTLVRNRNNIDTAITATPGCIGTSRSSATGFNIRNNNSNTFVIRASSAADSQNHYVFSRNSLGPNQTSNARLAFYSIGESLDLALLDARVTDLINAFATAIP